MYLSRLQTLEKRRENKIIVYFSHRGSKTTAAIEDSLIIVYQPLSQREPLCEDLLQPGDGVGHRTVSQQTAKVLPQLHNQ